MVHFAVRDKAGFITSQFKRHFLIFWCVYVQKRAPCTVHSGPTKKVGHFEVIHAAATFNLFLIT